MHHPDFIWMGIALSLGLSATEVHAVAVRQLDNFSVDLEGWRQGTAPVGDVGVTRATTGGPAGVGDAFLRIQADGSGSKGKLLAFNQSADWTGNYGTANVKTISMDVNNLGTTALQMRLAFGTSLAPLQGGNWFASTNPIPVPIGSGWTRIQFPLEASAFQSVQGTGSFDSVLAGVVTLRILHATSPDNNGSTVTGILGIDNIFTQGPPGLAGDHSGDSIVDAADYTVWGDTQGQAGFGLPADGTGPNGIPDGVVNQLDYDLWASRFGSTAGSIPAGIPQSVPEPSAVWSGICWALVLLPVLRAHRTL